MPQTDAQLADQRLSYLAGSTNSAILRDDSPTLTHDLPCMGEDSGKPQKKILHAGDIYNGQPSIVLSPNDISLSAGRTNGIAINDQFGTLITGPMQLSAMPAEMSFCGGYWRLDPRHLSTIASTTPTPIPLLVKSTPEILSASSDVDDEVHSMIAISDARLAYLGASGGG